MKNPTENLKLFGIYDIPIISLVLLLSFLLTLHGNGRNEKIIVEINGKPEYILTEPGIYRIEKDGRWIMDVEVEYDGKSGRKVRVVKSSCKFKICVRKGWIRDPKDSIICVPNKVIIHFGRRKNTMNFNKGIDVYTW